MWEYGAGVGIVSLRRDFASYDVEGTDGPIGTVDESSYDGSCAYLVVDIGSCIAGKKRMIPAGVVEGVDVVTRTVFVALSRETVEQAPDFEERHRHERDEHHTYFETHRRQDISSPG